MATTVKQLIEYLETLPGETEVYCVQEEHINHGDSTEFVPDYYPLNIGTSLTVEDDILYIGDITL